MVWVLTLFELNKSILFGESAHFSPFQPVRRAPCLWSLTATFLGPGNSLATNFHPLLAGFQPVSLIASAPSHLEKSCVPVFKMLLTRFDISLT